MSTSSLTRCFTSPWLRRGLPLLFAATVWIVACRGPEHGLTVFVSGDSLGYLEPCGCRRDQAGGLPGRARLIASANASDRLVVDVGNMTPGSRDYDRLKLKYLMQGMTEIGYDAVNLGKKEAELDLDTLKGVLKSSPLPFVSANVVAKSGKQPLTEPYRIVERDGVKIGIVGVANCDPADAGPGVEVLPPVEALAGVIPKLRPLCDYLMVLAFVDDDTIKDIANKYHEVDCILGGDVAQSSASVQLVNRAQVFSVTDRGKVIGRLEMVKKGDSLMVGSAKGVKIAADKVAPPKEIAALLAGFKNELRDRHYEFATGEGMEAIATTEGTSNEYVGAQACMGCHAEPHKVWSGTPHVNAFATIKKNGSEFDPDCLRCHTVGYGLSSGFIDAVRTPKLEGVQCESCHGRGKEHTITMRRSALKPVTPSTCIHCHDQENSENFRYEVFWPKIKH